MSGKEAQAMGHPGPILEVREDKSICRHQIANRLTNVERRLLTYFSKHQNVITCVGNIGAVLRSHQRFHRGSGTPGA